MVTYAYDARGRRTRVTDQAGNVIDEAYDPSGRLEERSVTTLASGFDGAVRRVEMAYDDLGRSRTVTQYDAATGGSVVDQVAFSYTGWGEVERFEQDRNSTVGASGASDDYEVSYTYAKATGGRNTIRRTGVTLPSGNAITYQYTSSGGQLEDDASRVSGVTDGAVVLARYDYNGLGQVVSSIYPEIGLGSVHHGSTSGVYDSWDRFNRVTNVSWSKPNGASVYDVDLEWDRAGNILSIDDHVHSGFDVGVTIDALDRVTRAHEGTLASGAITAPTRDQQWTLDHLGNWDQNLLDLNGDADFVDTDELDEDRSHNAVNEITARDIDDDGTDEYTLTYDAVGNLTDDGEEYEYVWDAFGRLRKIRDRSDSSLVEELTYNGLGFLIAEHYDTDEDGDVDAADKTYWYAYDERWRRVATFREDDTDPKEEWVHHQAGADGRGGASYINDVIAWYRDDNTAWTAASDGVLETRRYLCQNWRGDVVAIVGSAGWQVEQVRYSAYGVPFGLPGGDCDSDGDCDADDLAVIDGWIAASTYDPRGDVDLDGDVDVGDRGAVAGTYAGVATGREVVSSQGGSRADQGSMLLFGAGGHRVDRRRVRSLALGRWLSRDPVGYVHGVSLYAPMRVSPMRFVDPFGLTSVVVGVSFIPVQIGSKVLPGGDVEPIFELKPIFWPTRQSCDSICDEAKQQGLDNGSAGGVVCKGGKICPCAWAGLPPGLESGPASAMLDDCTKAHEQAHIELGHTSCDSSKGGALHRPPFSGDVNRDAAEADAYQVGKDCVDAFDCQGDIVCEVYQVQLSIQWCDDINALGGVCFD